MIRGTRVPVELLLRKMSEGASEADLLDAYPGLSADDLKAALASTADAVAHEEAPFVNLSGPQRVGITLSSKDQR